MTCEYTRSKRHLKLHMSDAIVCVLAKFKLTDCKISATPIVPVSKFDDLTPCTNFPVRSLLGSLQYIAS